MTEDAYRHRLKAARSRRREQVYRSLRKEEGEEDKSGDSSSSSGSDTEQTPPPVQAGGGENKILWAVLVLVLLVAVTGTAYFLFFRSPTCTSGSASSGTIGTSEGKQTVTTTEPVSTPDGSSSTIFLASTAVGSPSSSADIAKPSPSPSFSSSGTSDSSSTDASSPSSGEYDLSSLQDQGITAFLGNNSGGIASWYRTNSGRDSTNGRSWCEFPYDDTVPGFAPSVGTMRDNFGGDDAAAKKAFCGLWAVVYSPKTGKEVKLIIADGFDDAWIRDQEKHSIDVIKGSFAELFGEETDDKNDVVMDVWWMLTGERDEKFTYKGVGVG